MPRHATPGHGQGRVRVRARGSINSITQATDVRVRVAMHGVAEVGHPVHQPCSVRLCLCLCSSAAMHLSTNRPMFHSTMACFRPTYDPHSTNVFPSQAAARLGSVQWRKPPPTLPPVVNNAEEGCELSVAGASAGRVNACFHPERNSVDIRWAWAAGAAEVPTAGWLAVLCACGTKAYEDCKGVFPLLDTTAEGCLTIPLPK